MGDNRDTSVAFGDLRDDLEAERFPLAAGELLERYGDHRLEHAGSVVTLGELLGRGSAATYESADDVHQAVLDAVEEGSEARRGDTDGEVDARGEDFEQQSF